MTTQTVGVLTPRVDAEMASEHLRLLHAGATGFVSIVLLRGVRSTAWSFVPVELLGQESTDAPTDVAELQDIVDARWNVYTGCAAYDRLPERGRGRRDDVSTLPGVWADLDVKPGTEGYFQTADECRAYLDRLPTPTLTVATGSGGLHAYWLVHADRRLNRRAGEELLVRWRDYLLSEAAGYALDAVQDVARVLKLAGTVRWPKDGEDRLPALVQLEEPIGPRYQPGELILRTETAHYVAQQRRQRLQLEQQRLREQRQALLAQYGGDALRTYDRLREQFEQVTTWDELLVPTGWTLFADNRLTLARCRYWTRPGKSASDGKSASTDFHDDQLDLTSAVMAIYSRDPELDDLAELVTEHGQVICSKWHYARQRLYHGSERELVAALGQHGGRLP